MRAVRVTRLSDTVPDVSAHATLIAARYDGLEPAESALGALRRLVDVHDAAFVEKDAAGRVVLRQTKEHAVGESLVGGGTAGVLLGLVVGFPVAGAVLGLASGAGWGAFDRGLPNAPLRTLGESLERGDVLLVALAGSEDEARLRSALAPYGDRLLIATVSRDQLSAALAAAEGLGAEP